MPKKQVITGVMLTAAILLITMGLTFVIVVSPYKEFAQEVMGIFLAMFTLVSMVILIIFAIVFGKKGFLLGR